ncbi:DUF4489 domain-containing protein [Wukongibacter baidiensis]|uniref:DUF4489 domain-containing protein n=1 Tax=Wukongibacter baidiensis TaxID=1723361 RepID=UPI003D7F954E
MNYNYSHGDYIVCEPDIDCAKCKAMHPWPKGILLECGEGTGSRTFTASNDAPFQLAHVTVDTACLNKSEVLIKFSSLVSMEVLVNTGTVRLQYELFRACDGREPICLGTWMYENVNVFDRVFENIEESFSFIFCECLNCQRCCDYFVTVTPIDIVNATATVNNGRIAALSQSLCNSLNKHEAGESKNRNTKFKQNHPIPKKILLECGKGSGGITFNDTTDPAATIAYVTIDTTCLSKSKILIDFSSMIYFSFGTDSLSLKFELLRVCNDGQPASLGTWIYELSRGASGVQNIDVNEAFSFIFCDSLTCSGSCKYIVMASVIDARQTDSNNLVLVYNGRISALAQPLIDCHSYDTHENCGEISHYANCNSKCPEPKKILLECGSGNISKTFTSESQQTPFQLAHVTIDTARLSKPVVNIEFSSNVSFESISGNRNGTLRYELFRVCGDDKTLKSLGVWSIGRRFTTNIDKATKTFNFTFCDNINCLGCCEYFVSVTPIGISGLSITVDNGRIAALAQSSNVE